VDEAQAQRESLLTALSEKLHRRVYQLKANVNLEVDALVLENRFFSLLLFFVWA